MTPKLSVLMITYNQEKFIAQAVDSVLMQKTDFDYEIVIGEDRSTDKTRQILLDYQARHPKKIHLLLHEKNLGSGQNIVTTWEKCRGKYIALLEGDDYWTAKEKLQTQVDFLEASPTYSMTFHNVTMLFDNGTARPWKYIPKNVRRKTFYVQDLFKNNFIPTGSVVARREALSGFPAWFPDLTIGDWPLFLMLAHRGPIKFFNRFMGVYRVHAGSTIAGLPDSVRLGIHVVIFRNFNIYSGFQYNKHSHRALFNTFANLAWRHLKTGNINASLVDVGAFLKHLGLYGVAKIGEILNLKKREVSRVRVLD